MHPQFGGSFPKKGGGGMPRGGGPARGGARGGGVAGMGGARGGGVAGMGGVGPLFDGRMFQQAQHHATNMHFGRPQPLLSMPGYGYQGVPGRGGLGGGGGGGVGGYGAAGVYPPVPYARGGGAGGGGAAYAHVARNAPQQPPPRRVYSQPVVRAESRGGDGAPEKRDGYNIAKTTDGHLIYLSKSGEQLPRRGRASRKSLSTAPSLPERRGEVVVEKQTFNVFAMLANKHKKAPVEEVVLDAEECASEAGEGEGEGGGAGGEMDESCGSRPMSLCSPQSSPGGAECELRMSPGSVKRRSRSRSQSKTPKMETGEGEGEGEEEVEVLCVTTTPRRPPDVVTLDSGSEAEEDDDDDDDIILLDVDSTQLVLVDEWNLEDDGDVTVIEEPADPTPQPSPMEEKRKRKRSVSRRRSSIGKASVLGYISGSEVQPLCYTPAQEETVNARECAAEFGLPLRYWEDVQSPPSTDYSLLRVCSYNVLCQLTTNTTMYLYGHLSSRPDLLGWQHRRRLLEQDLKSLSADILGLQEVQCEHWDDFYRPTMDKMGYDGVYKKRTGEFHDGCAVFYRKERFQLVKYQIVEYMVDRNSNMDRDQIGQVLLLLDRESGSHILVGNTHILYNDSRGDVKMGQMACLFANMHEMSVDAPNAPMFITGDFNIEPYSTVYKYITESRVDTSGVPRNEISGQGKRGGPLVNYHVLPPGYTVGQEGVFKSRVGSTAAVSSVWTHPFRLQPSHRHWNKSDEREVSTYHKDSANPDFIFYGICGRKRVPDQSTVVRVLEKPRMRLLRRYALPDLDLLRNTFGPLPNKVSGSDHLPLLAEFAISK